MKTLKTAKECAYIAVFVAVLIAAQFMLSAVPGVEVVTVFFVAYVYVFGVWRGAVAAVAFSLLRQFVFGFFPTVLILYLLYYVLLAVVFGALGRKGVKGIKDWKTLFFVVPIACACTVAFTLLDNVITPLWLAASRQAAKAYFISSLSFMIPHVLCVGITVGLLFLPIAKVFLLVKGNLCKNK